VRQHLDSIAKAFVAGHVEQIIDDLLERLPVNMPAQSLRNLAHGVVIRRSHSEATFPPDAHNRSQADKRASVLANRSSKQGALASVRARRIDRAGSASSTSLVETLGFAVKFCELTSGELGCMWEQLIPADIERAKHRLTNQRMETLTRHAEELKALDTEQAEMEDLERAVSAFASKHLTTAASAASSITTVAGGSTPAAESSESRAPGAPGDVYPPRLQVHHETSPNFGMPFRRLVRG
jgi:hypothetical protein